LRRKYLRAGGRVGKTTITIKTKKKKEAIEAEEFRSCRNGEGNVFSKRDLLQGKEDYRREERGAAKKEQTPRKKAILSGGYRLDS